VKLFRTRGRRIGRSVQRADEPGSVERWADGPTSIHLPGRMPDRRWPLRLPGRAPGQPARDMPALRGSIDNSSSLCDGCQGVWIRPAGGSRPPCDSAARECGRGRSRSRLSAASGSSGPIRPRATGSRGARRARGRCHGVASATGPGASRPSTTSRSTIVPIRARPARRRSCRRVGGTDSPCRRRDAMVSREGPPGNRGATYREDPGQCALGRASRIPTIHACRREAFTRLNSARSAASRTRTASSNIAWLRSGSARKPSRWK
jgi:hypothetical protein